VKLPSFSKLELAALCQYPWTSGKPHNETTSEAAALGKAVHSMAQCLAIWGDAPVGDIADANGLDQDNHEQLINAYVELLDQLGHEQLTDRWRAAEVCFGLQLDTGLVRHIDFERRWRRRHNEVVGVIDLVREDEDGRLRVRDYKTGRGALYMKPSDSLQMLCYGLAATRLYRRDRVIVELCQVGSELWLEVDEMDDLLLDWTWERLHEVERLVLDQGNNVPRPGPHCRELYCPIVDRCEATQASLVAIDAAADLSMPLTVSIESDEHARYIYGRLSGVKAALKAVEDALHERHQLWPLDLGDGRVLANWETERESVIVNKASLTVLNAHLENRALDIVEQKVTKTAIKELCKEVGPPRGGPRLFNELWDRLRAAGAVNTSKYTRFEARKRVEGKA
jgi:hypothetical protein